MNKMHTQPSSPLNFAMTLVAITVTILKVSLQGNK